MHPLLIAALQRASQTGQSVPVTIGNVTLTAYPNGQVGGPPGSTTARWTPQTTSMPVPPRPPYGAVPSTSSSLISNQPVGARTGLFTPTTGPVGSTITWPSFSSLLPQNNAGPASSSTSFTGPATYTDPTTLQSFGYIPSTGAVVASGPGYGQSTVIPQTSQSGPLGSTGPVDRHDAASAKNARLYRMQHGLATADDSAATDALNAESLAAARTGRNYFNPQLAAQYGQAPAAGTYGPRTDVVQALQMPPQQGQSIMLAPTATTVQTQQPTNLLQYLPQQRSYAPYAQSSQYAGNNLLQQGMW